MPSPCSVIGCKSRMNAGPKKQFFRFPLNRPKILQQWLMVLDRLDWVPKPSSKICSEHFATEDFLFRPNVNIPRLKPEAVPSIFPDPSTTQEDDSSVDEMKDEAPLLNKEESPEKSLDENSVDKDIQLPDKSKPLLSEDIYPNKRPRRTSKINVKMKDFILLDDLKKLNKPISLDKSKPKLIEKEPSIVKMKSSERLEISHKSKSNDKLDDSSEPNVSKGLEVSKVNAAKELLSILEDSGEESNLSTETGSQPFKNGNISEVGSSESSSEDDLQPILTANHLKKYQKKAAKKFKIVSKPSSKVSPTFVNISEIASKVKAPSCSQKVISAKLMENNLDPIDSIDSSASPQISLSRDNKMTSISNDRQPKHFELVCKSNISDIKIPMHIRTKRPSTDLAKTYFPIRCGENYFYFSYAELNPVVDLSRHNVLIEEDSQNVNDDGTELGTINDITTSTNKTQIKKKVKRKSEEMESDYEKNKKKYKGHRDISHNISNAEKMTSATTEIDIDSRTEVQKSSESNETGLFHSPSVSENNIILNDPVEFASENNLDNLQSSDDIIDIENVKIITSTTKKRKKRFKTVAEIVVRTDNSKPGEAPNVSIDKINKIVDFKATKSSAVKNLRRGKSNREDANVVDVNDNLNTISNDEELSEEELARLSERITDTVKRMKLLDKVKGNTSKLTVLITTLPPVKEKEILIIKKKNLETNTIQSRELQVVISSNKTNEGTLNGNIVVTNPLGYTILPASKNNNPHVPSENDSSLKNSDDGFASDQEHATVVCFQDQFGVKETFEKDGATSDITSFTPSESIEFSDSMNESVSTAQPVEKEKNSSEVIKHDHPYISPNVKLLLSNPNVSLNLAEVQSKETAFKMKLTENEIIFRNKVGKKLRTLKDNIKKKNDTIGKLKDKVKFLERSLRDVKRTKRNSAKAAKKDSHALLNNDIFYGVDQLVDTSDFNTSMDYSLNNIEIPLGLEENAEESDDDGERECSSPITYLCEPAIEVPCKDRET